MRAAAVLAAVLLLASAAPLDAQSRRPMAPDHWSYDLLELLHGLGVPEAELHLVRGVSGTGHLEALTGALERVRGVGGSPAAGPSRFRRLEPFLLTWTRGLGAEVGTGGGPVAQVEGGWADRPALPVESPRGYGRALLAGDLFGGVTLWGEGVLRDRGGGEALRSLGVGIPVGSFDLFVGRMPLRMGEGRDPFLLNGRTPVDGATLTSRTPFRLPGALEGLGAFRFHVGFSPFISSPLTSRAWLGSFGLSWSPHSRVDLGILRTTRFAGEDIEPFNWDKFLRMLAWQGQNDAFDDNQGEVAAQVRWGLGGQHLTTYVSLGFEDRQSTYEDPGLLLGGFLPLLRPEALYALRYEFLAFGRRAYWCGSCEKSHHAWYLSPKFGAYFLDGEPLGALLGGYGASHRGRLELWLSRSPVRAWVEHLRAVRNPGNVLLDPSLVEEPAAKDVTSWTVGAGALLGGRWSLSGSLQRATLDGEETMGGSVAIRVLAGG